MNWQDYLNAQSDKYGIPRSFVNAIVAGESRGRPGIVSAPNTNGTYDYGLFQLNSGGQGMGIAPAILLDPIKNIDIAFNNTSQGLAKTYAAGLAKGLTGNDLFTYFVDHSGHRSLNIRKGVYDPSGAIKLLQEQPVTAPDGSGGTMLPYVPGKSSKLPPGATGGISPSAAVAAGLTYGFGETPVPTVAQITADAKPSLPDIPGLVQKSIYIFMVGLIVIALFGAGIYLAKG